jgi:hypothetical protein
VLPADVDGGRENYLIRTLENLIRALVTDACLVVLLARHLTLDIHSPFRLILAMFFLICVKLMSEFGLAVTRFFLF